MCLLEINSLRFWLSKWVKVSNITVVGCYKPPSATRDALKYLLIFIKWLFWVLSYGLFKLGLALWDLRLCDSLGRKQLINAPTRLNPKVQHKSILLDLIITNAAHKFTSTVIFCNYISDHCVIACVQDTKIPKEKPCYIFKKCWGASFFAWFIP